MAQNFQSSFIPKESATEEVFEKKGMGIVGVIMVTLTLATIAAAAGVYFYERMIKSDISNLQTQLVEAEKTIDKDSINKISDFSKKLSISKNLLNNHRTVSGFMNDLASSTVGLLGWSSLSYDFEDDGGLTVKLSGEAPSYAAIAFQEDVFSKDKYFKSMSFSNIKLTSKGAVTFDLDISVSPDIAIYAP